MFKTSGSEYKAVVNTLGDQIALYYNVMVVYFNVMAVELNKQQLNDQSLHYSRKQVASWLSTLWSSKQPASGHNKAFQHHSSGNIVEAAEKHLSEWYYHIGLQQEMYSL